MIPIEIDLNEEYPSYQLNEYVFEGEMWDVDYYLPSFQTIAKIELVKKRGRLIYASDRYLLACWFGWDFTFHAVFEEMRYENNIYVRTGQPHREDISFTETIEEFVERSEVFAKYCWNFMPRRSAPWFLQSE